MATTSKLNNNLLLLASKRTQNLRRSLCRFKSLKFGANSNFPNSTSSAPIINNVAVSIYSDSSQQPKFSFKRAASDEVKSSGATNKNNWFDAVKNNALNLLKSNVKVAAALMMLGMMMINGHKPKPALALAFPGQGGYLFSASTSSSLTASSSPRGCPLCSHGCIFCADQPTTKDGSTIDSDMKFLVFAMHFIICLAMAVLVFLVVVLVDLFNSSFTSIFKIQLGLLDSEDLQRDLNFIKQTLNKSSYSARPSVLEDAIKVLDWHSNNCLFSYSSGNILWEKVGDKFFSKLLYKERTKFDKERPVYLRNVNTDNITSRIQAYEFKNTYTVVTLLVAFSGRHKLPTICNRGDLDRVLKKLKSYNSKTELEGADLVWVPRKGNEIMSLEQLKKNYPRLRPFNSANNSLKLDKFNKFIKGVCGI